MSRYGDYDSVLKNKESYIAKIIDSSGLTYQEAERISRDTVYSLREACILISSGYTISDLYENDFLLGNDLIRQLNSRAKHGSMSEKLQSAVEELKSEVFKARRYFITNAIMFIFGVLVGYYLC